MNPDNAIPESYNIKIGESNTQFSARYSKYMHVNVQPAGLNFYSIQPGDRGIRATVHFEHGKHSFDLSNMTGVMGTYDTALPNEGISDYHLFFATSPASETPHDEARHYILNVIKTLKTAGWKVNIDRSSPRVRGKEAFELLIKRKLHVYDLDPDYEPTLEEWMQIEDMTRWSFYADNVFLEMYFQRDRHAKDPAKGGYLLSMDIVSGETYYRGAGENRLRWRERWPEIERENTKTRWDAEYQAARQCLHIDFDYQDPPLPPDFKYTPPKPPGLDKATYERARVDCIATGKTQSESPTSPSASNRLPLKSKATSAVNCPQTGIWECAADAPGITEHRRFIEVGQPMPYGVMQHTAKGLGGLLGGKEDDTVEITWVLMAYKIEEQT